MIDRNKTIKDEEIGSIDQSIDVCDDYIRKHRHNARLTIMIFFCSIAFVSLPVMTFNLIGRGSTFPELFSNALILSFVAIFTIVFGVTMSIYRFHLNEISKMEHFKIGFLRIRVAANNISEGFQGEVRNALTESAFTFQPTSSGFGRPKKVDNPFPGHPGVDLTTTILNKLLDGMEIKPRRRVNEQKKL